MKPVGTCWKIQYVSPSKPPYTARTTMLIRSRCPTDQAYADVPARNAALNSQNSQPSVTSRNQVNGSRGPPRGLSKIAASAGLSVSELNAEITVETAMVTANWRKNCPVMPLMNAHGTNTADSTSATAITGPAT